MEVNGDALCGIHSGSEGECSNDIHLSLFGIHSESERECSNDIRLFLCGIHSKSEGEFLNNIRMFCLVYIRGRKESARMIYICIVWYTFRVGRGVLEWYTVRNKIG